MAEDIADLGLAVHSDTVPTATNRLKGLADQSSRTEIAVAKLIGVVGKLVAAYATWQVAEAIVRKYISATAESERVQTQLTTALKSTGMVAGQTLQSLNAHSDALKRMTAYDDEAIGGAQALLLTFTKIRGDTFPKATEAVLNLATAMHTDLNSAAIQVGKALNDPILGMTALTRSGIQFTEQQKQMVKHLIESNDMIGAQKIILKELEKQFGGSAQAARGTLGGALSALQNAFDDLFEATGPAADSLRDAVEGLIDKISDPAFIQSVQNFGSALFDALSQAIPLITKILDFMAKFPSAVNPDKSTIEDRYRKENGLPEAPRFGRNGASDNVVDITVHGGVKVVPAQAGPTADQITAMERAAKDYAKLTLGARQFTEQQQLQASSLGKTAEETSRLTHEQDLLNKAANDNIKLTPAQRREIEGLAASMASAEEHTRQLTEAYNFGKETLNGFFSDLKSNLQQGQSLWESFGNAAANVLNKIADKALGMAADGIWNSIFGAISGGLTGGLGGGATGGSLGAGLWGSAIFGHNAAGTDNWRGGPTWIGENGPELVNLPKGSQVIPSGQSMAMAANQNSPTVNVSIDARGSTKESVSELKQWVASGAFHSAVRGVVSNSARSN